MRNKIDESSFTGWLIYSWLWLCGALVAWLVPDQKVACLSDFGMNNDVLHPCLKSRACLLEEHGHSKTVQSICQSRDLLIFTSRN